MQDQPEMVRLTVLVQPQLKEELQRFARADASSISCQARRAFRNYASEMHAEAAAIVQRHYDRAYADASRDLETV